jgi:hypothetical protein
MRQVKKTKVVFGTVTLSDPVDDTGNALTGVGTDVPFIMDIKNRDSIRDIDGAIKAIQRLNALPINYNLSLTAQEHTLPTGNTYASIVSAVTDKVEIKPSDSDVFKGFLDWITWANDYVNGQWDDHNKKGVSKGMSDIISKTVSQDDSAFVDIEGVAV